MPNATQETTPQTPSMLSGTSADTAGASPGTSPNRKRKLLITLAAMTFLFLLFFIGRYFIWASGHEETDDAYLQGHIHQVSSRVAGTVNQVLVDDNQIVQAGQVLVQLDGRDYQVKLDQAQASLDVAMRQAEAARASVKETATSAVAQRSEASGGVNVAIAGIANAKAQLQAASAGIPKAQADLARARATENREQLDLKRYQDLLTKGQVSRQTVEHAQEAYQVAVADSAAQQQAIVQARAQQTSAQEGIASAQAALQRSQGFLQSADASKLDVNVRDAQFSTAQATVAQAKAALEDARLQLSYTHIVAPVAGRIARKTVEAGQRLQVGQPLLAVVEEKPWIVANFKETQLEKLRPGQVVDIRVDSFPGHTFHGRVDSVSPGSGNQFSLLPPDNATGNFTKIVQRIPVKIVFDADSMRGFDDLLIPGSSAVVTVSVKGKE